MSTPPRTTSAALQHTTPLSKGSSSRVSENVSGQTLQSLEPYLRHDVATEKKLSLNAFMTLILDSPDWMERVHSSETQDIAEDNKFKQLLKDYVDAGPGPDHYYPFVVLANYTLTKKNKKHPDTNAFYRNDPTIVSGSYASRKPDVIAANSEAIFNGTRISDDSCKNEGPKGYPFHWGELRSFVEFKLKADESGTLTKSDSRLFTQRFGSFTEDNKSLGIWIPYV
jgi:hypothetical protein